MQLINKAYRFSALVLLALLVAVPCEGAGGGEDLPPPDIQKIWRQNLTLDFEEKENKLKWEDGYIDALKHITEKEYTIPLNKKGKILNGKNTALLRLGLIFTGSDGQPKYESITVPFVFLASLADLLSPDEKPEYRHKARTTSNLKQTGYQSANLPAALQVVELNDFLSTRDAHPYDDKRFADPVFRRGIGDAKGAAAAELMKSLNNIFHENNDFLRYISSKPPSHFFHSEQGMILFLYNQSSEEHWHNLMHEIIRMHNISQEIPVQAIVLEILSYYSACEKCTTTLSHFTQNQHFINNIMRPQLHEVGFILQEHAPLIITESSIRVFDPAGETRQQHDQHAQLGEKINYLLNPGGIYHRMPLDILGYEGE